MSHIFTWLLLGAFGYCGHRHYLNFILISRCKKLNIFRHTMFSFEVCLPLKLMIKLILPIITKAGSIVTYGTYKCQLLSSKWILMQKWTDSLTTGIILHIVSSLPNTLLPWTSTGETEFLEKCSFKDFHLLLDKKKRVHKNDFYFLSLFLEKSRALISYKFHSEFIMHMLFNNKGT